MRNIKLTAEQRKRLDILADACGFAITEEMMPHVFALWEWMVSEVQKGNEIASVDDKQEVMNVIESELTDTIRRIAKERPSSKWVDSLLKDDEGYSKGI